MTRTLRQGWVAVGLLLGASGCCWGIVGRLEVGEANYELLAAQDPFAGLVHLRVGSGCCDTTTGSGFLLDNAWVISAAHVVCGRDPATISVEWGGVSSPVAALRVPDEWMGTRETGLDQGGDLVLLRLAEPFDFGGRTPLATGSLDDRFAVMLGTGKGGNGVLGAFDTPRARAATNTIDRQFVTSGGGGLLATDFDSGNSPQNTLDAASVSRRYYDDGFSAPLPADVLLTGVDPTSRPRGEGGGILPAQFTEFTDLWLEGTTAAGDSGGPLFVFDEAADEWQLAGVTSWGFNPSLPEGFSRHDSRYGDVALFTDLSRHQEWIAATIPEPGAPMLVAAALAGLLVRRRQSESRTMVRRGEREDSKGFACKVQAGGADAGDALLHILDGEAGEEDAGFFDFDPVIEEGDADGGAPLGVVGVDEGVDDDFAQDGELPELRFVEGELGVVVGGVAAVVADAFARPVSAGIFID